MSEELLLTLYERAWNAGDPDACAGCFAADGVREIAAASYGPRVTAARGREAIRDEIALVMEAVPDLEVAVSPRATPATGASGPSGAWGTRVADAGAAGWRSVGVSVFRLSNAGFREERLYWDSAFAG